MSRGRCRGGSPALPYTTDDADATGITHSSCKLWASGNVHASQHDGVVDLQKICDRGPYLLFLRLSTRLKQDIDTGVNSRGDAMAVEKVRG